MSLICEVLQLADKASTEDYKKYHDNLLPKVKDLNERIQLFCWALHQNFVDTYQNFTITKSLEQLNYANRKANIQKDFQNVTEEVEKLHEKFPNVKEDFSANCDKLNKSYSSLQDLSTVVEGKRLLEKANHEFGRYNYSEAMLSVKDLLKKLKALKFEGKDLKALFNMTSQAEDQLSLYSAQLSVEWEDIFTWSERKGVYFLTYSLSVQQSDTTLIRKVLKTLYDTERMNAELGLFSHFFIDQLLQNVIKHNCDIFTEDHIGAIVFNIKIDLSDNSKPSYQTIFNNLTAVFEFLQSTLGCHFDCERNFIAVFSDSIRDKFFYKIIENCIRNNLPSCESTHQNYRNLVQELDLFNKFLIDLQFVEADQSPLNKYIDDTECVLYNKKCDKLLSDVRSLLGESLSYGTLVVGSSLDTEYESLIDDNEKEVPWDIHQPLFLPKCVISQNVKRIMSMIVAHLEESAKLPDKYSDQLVTYVKDIAVMYQCIVPKKFKINLQCCPLDIALFFNNCFYLAHGLLGPPWKVSLPLSLAEQLASTLLECIQDLRVLGLEKISLYLQKQKDVIVSSIETTEPTAWSHETYESFDSAINNAITFMNELKSSWHNVLPTRMYEMSVCTLVQALFQTILNRIFANTQPICEELVFILALRLNDTAEQVVLLFEEPIEFEKKIASWVKFTKMPKLLKAQLLEMADLWKNNKELGQSYTCEEVRQIIKVRFPDNKYRLKILKEIQ